MTKSMFFARPCLKTRFGTTQEIVNSLLPSTSNYNIMSMSTIGSSSAGQSNSSAFMNVFSRQNRESTIVNIHNKKTGLRFVEESLFPRKASVLIPLCYDKQGMPAILYTLRSLNMNKHSGEVSFPGGAADPEDEGNVITTALRETEEELGISRKDVDIWTTMNPMPTLVSLMGVTPVLAFLRLGNVDPDTLKINTFEVEKAFTVTLEHLSNPLNQREKMRFGVTMPVFDLKNLNVRHRKTAESDEPPDVPLWGLTSIITHLALEALIPDLYTRRIPFFEAKVKNIIPKGDSKL